MEHLLIDCVSFFINASTSNIVIKSSEEISLLRNDQRGNIYTTTVGSCNIESDVMFDANFKIDIYADLDNNIKFYVFIDLNN